MVVKAMEEVCEPTTPSKVGHQGPGYDGNPVQLDHCYAKPWNWRQETAHCKPVRTLFSDESTLTSYEEPIDVNDVCPSYKNGRLIDREATNNSFFDAEQRLSLIISDNDAADWEETVKRDGWTPLQHRIFNKVVKLLVGDNMARLATAKIENEAVQKKILIEGSSKKLRIILSSIAWDIKITQWLHLTLIEHLSRDYLLCYISILQVLRSKVPTLVDRLLTIPVANLKLLNLNNQIMGFVTNKPWKPVIAPSNLNINKLSVAPVIVMVPSGTNNSLFSTSHGSKRHQTWLSLFQTLGTVVTVSLPNSPPPHSLPLPAFVESLINATAQKVQESRTMFPGRPIVLAGIQQGALIAAQVAQLEQISALIFLGFPLFCVDGKRGEPDDFILDLKSPTIFVIGQSSSNCTVDGIEQLRYRMKAESYLVVVDGAMDSLRMLKWKKKQQNLTQAMVDTTILNEISTFLTNVLSQPSTPGSGKKSPVERKPEPNSPAGGLSKRPRFSLDPDEGNSALSSHNYSQNTPFQPPWKGRTGTGLARVRGGRIGPTQNRTTQPKSQPETTPTPGKLRIGRPLNAGTYRLQGGTVEAITPTKTNKFHRQQSGQSDLECDEKYSADSSQNSPKDESGITGNSESRGGGDSSETESAPPAEDDEEMMMEDFRFASELMSKQNSTPLKRDDDNPDDEFILRFSGDEAEVRRPLSRENRAQSRNQVVGSPE